MWCIFWFDLMPSEKLRGVGLRLRRFLFESGKRHACKYQTDIKWFYSPSNTAFRRPKITNLHRFHLPFRGRGHRQRL